MIENHEPSFDHLIFDLDDTLLDTFGQLIPQASKEACAAMIESGLATDLDSCLFARNEMASTGTRKDLFLQIAEKFGSANNASTQTMAQAGARAFYDRRVGTQISLFPGLRDLLHDLRGRYGLHLVTAGHPDTQNEKIEILKIRNAFDTITVVDTFANEIEKRSKAVAFHAIARITGGQPARHLSVGNRLETDIAPAKAIGWTTCWVRYGEYAKSTPTTKSETPDFTLNSIQELMRTCRL